MNGLLLIEHTTLHSNTAAYGGALGVKFSRSVQLTNVTFSANAATTISSGDALYVSEIGSESQLTNLTFRDHRSDGVTI
eukprot:5063260-Prymnesium_polylepis.1